MSVLIIFGKQPHLLALLGLTVKPDIFCSSQDDDHSQELAMCELPISLCCTSHGA